MQERNKNTFNLTRTKNSARPMVTRRIGVGWDKAGNKPYLVDKSLPNHPKLTPGNIIRIHPRTAIIWEPLDDQVGKIHISSIMPYNPGNPDWPGVQPSYDGTTNTWTALNFTDSKTNSACNVSYKYSVSVNADAYSLPSLNEGAQIINQT